MKVGEKIKRRREELGLSAEKLAEKIGVSRATEFRYENGFIEKLPSNVLVPLANALHVQPGYFLSDKDSDVESLSAFDQKLISAYHSHTVKERGLVCQLLDIEDPSLEEDAKSSDLGNEKGA
jgi:transcriptional regulator with XRE-family HTH domain